MFCGIEFRRNDKNTNFKKIYKNVAESHDRLCPEQTRNIKKVAWNQEIVGECY